MWGPVLSRWPAGDSRLEDGPRCAPAAAGARCQALAGRGGGALGPGQPQVLRPGSLLRRLHAGCKRVLH